MDREGSLAPASVLEQFGVPPSAQGVWRVLLRTPNIELDELLALEGLSAAQFSMVASALLEAQLVHESDSPAGLTAIDPSLAVETQIARAERQLAERAEGFASLRALIPDLTRDYARGRAEYGPQPGIEVLESVHDIRRHIYLAAETTVSDARSMYYSTTVAGIEDGLRADLDMIARGVRCRSIVGPHELSDPALFAELEAWHRHGELFRTLPEIPNRTLIFDRKLAVMMVDPADHRLGAAFVRVPSIVEMLVLLFDHLWSIADPIFNAASEPDIPVGRQARTLELMAIGTKDERIARTLGVGTRTVRRDISDLKAMLRVSSRAEIVAAAVRKGWV
jgi:DNA-binding CsgD family transcriptional regulator